MNVDLGKGKENQGVSQEWQKTKGAANLIHKGFIDWAAA